MGPQNTMNRKLVYATVYVALAVGMTSNLFVDAIASTGGDPRAEQACDKMVDLEGKQDARTEFDSTIPDSDRGTQKAFEGSHRALGDCPLEP